MDAPSPIPRHRFVELNRMALPLRLGSFAGGVLNWGLIAPHPWRNALHTHSFFEVCYAFQGRGVFRLADAEHQVGTGDLFVARPREPHQIISSDEDPLGIYFWAYTLVPTRDRAPDGGEIDALVDAFLRSPCRVSPRAPTLGRTLELLTEEIDRRQPGYAQAIAGLVFKLLLDTSRAVTDLPRSPAPAAPTARGHAEAVSQRVVRYLRDNHGRALSVRDVAAAVHLGERQANRLFRRVMGVSILEYLTTLRLEVAAQLLLDRHLAIKAVAQACGYPNVRYFTTLFRQRTGLTPAAYRRQGGTRFLEPSAPGS